MLTVAGPEMTQSPIWFAASFSTTTPHGFAASFSGSTGTASPQSAASDLKFTAHPAGISPEDVL